MKRCFLKWYLSDFYIEKAKRHGLGMVAARNSTHYGIADDIMRALRGSQKAPGAKRIYTCGGKEYLASLERAEAGVLVNEALQRDMLTMRDELGLDFPFAFE